MAILRDESGKYNPGELGAARIEVQSTTVGEAFTVRLPIVHKNFRDVWNIMGCFNTETGIKIEVSVDDPNVVQAVLAGNEAAGDLHWATLKSMTPTDNFLQTQGPFTAARVTFTGGTAGSLGKVIFLGA